MKRFFIIFIAICLVLTTTGCTAKRLLITIKVFDEETEAPLNDVKITLTATDCSQAGQAFTDGEGISFVNFDCSLDEPQAVNVSLEKEGYALFNKNESRMIPKTPYTYKLRRSGFSPTATPVTPNTPSPTDTTGPISTVSPQETNTKAPDPEPVLPHSTTQLAFVREVNGIPEIFLTDKNESFIVQITNNTDGACQPAWKPDGTELVFITPCNRRLDEYSSTSLYRIPVPANPQEIITGEGEFMFTSSGGAYEPAWSSINGIIYTGKETGNRKQIYRIANPENPSRVLLSNPSSEEFGGSFSSDGMNVLAFRILPGYPDGLLYWMPFENFQENISPNWIVKQGFDVREPDWQPNGDLIVFVHQNQLWTSVQKSRKLNNVTQLTQAGNVHDPDWSPDGNFIAFSVDKSGLDLDIWYVPLAGSPIKKIAVTTAPEYQPAWRPMPQP